RHSNSQARENLAKESAPQPLFETELNHPNSQAASRDDIVMSIAPKGASENEAIIRSTKTLDKNSISIAAMGLESEGSSISHDELLARIQQALIEIACSVLSINFEDIDIDIELNEYGFDSVTLTSF